MGSSSPPTVIRAPGRLVMAPTDLSIAFPYGGTELGSVRMVTWQKYAVDFALTAEEFGFEPVEFNQAGEVYGLGAFMRGVDDDVVGSLFPNTSTGATSQHKVVTWPGANRAGSWRSAAGVKLLFAPYNTRDVDAIIMYRAVPMVEASARVPLEWVEEYGFPAVFAGIRDASGNGGQKCRLSDMTVSP